MEQATDSEILSVLHDPSFLRKMIDKLDDNTKEEYNEQLQQKVNERLQKQKNELNFKTELGLERDKAFRVAKTSCLIACIFSFICLVCCLNTNNELYKDKGAIPIHIMITLFSCICIIIFVPSTMLEEQYYSLAKKYNMPTLNDIRDKIKRKYEYD